MMESAETRWFLPGSPSPEVKAWFTQDSNVEPADPEERIDRYLDVRGSDTVGVKVRGSKSGESKLEVKARVGDPTAAELADGVSGHVDRWVKWSVSSREASDWVDEAHGSSDWTSIRKSRVVRKFTRIDGSWREAVGDDFLESGCQIELAEIIRHEARWWTFGFEAFGAAPSLHEEVRSCAGHWFSGFGPVPGAIAAGLDLQSSLSYPQWLASFRDGTRGYESREQ